MKLFESSWRHNWDYFERYYDTNLNKSVKRKIDLPCEWFEEYSKGDYSYILDDNVKLKRCQGKSKDGKDHFGFIDPMYRNIRDNYWEDSKYNKTPKVLYIDLETFVGRDSVGFPVPDKAKEEINLIQVFDNQLKTMFIIGSREWYQEKDYDFDYTVKYIQVKNEIELLTTYLKLFKALNPLIIYAWNGNGFDFPYIYNRLKNLGMDTNQLSNYGDCNLKEKPFNGKTLYSINSNGHYYIDLMDVYKKFVFKPRASYSLDNIAFDELGKNKVDHSCYNKFQDFYDGNYTIPENPTEEQLNSKIYKAAIAGNDKLVKELSYSDFVYYGAIDTHLISELDNKLNFTQLLFMVSEKMGVLVDEAMGTVKPWSQYISNRSHITKQVLPKRQQNDDEISIVGGYVREPQVGKHKWILSADVSSMYPLLGMTGFNMSPETFVPKHQLPEDLREVILRYFNDEDEKARLNMTTEEWNLVTPLLKKYNYSLGINGAVFDNNNGQGMVPEMVSDIYASRKIAKKTMLKYAQQKVIIKQVLDKKSKE